MKLFILRLVFGLLACTSACAQQPNDFMERVDKTSARYQEAARSQASVELIRAGHVSEANARLMALVPDAKKGADDYFVLGNLLYKLDPGASDVAMKRAEAMLPNQPDIWLERGMREHRNGNCPAALPYYDKYLASAQGKDQWMVWAYATHCRLMQGDVKEAQADWSHADFGRHHVSIEESMYEIFSRTNPNLEREAKTKLVAQGGHGRVDALCDLVYVDQNWETTWWNIDVNQAYLDYDIDMGKHMLQGDAAGLADFSLCHGIDQMEAEEFKKRITSAGYWGAGARLPESPRLAFLIITKLADTKIATPEALLAAYERPLVVRLQAHPDDLRTRDVLAFLYARAHDHGKLASIERYGWKTLHSQKYAESFMAEQSIAPGSDFRSLLDAAVAEFPDSALLARRQINEQELDAKKLKVERAHYIATQFANVAFPLANDEHSLGAYMAWLAHPDAPDPGKTWEHETQGDGAKWSQAKLADADAYARTLATTSYVVVQDGRIVHEYGDTARPVNLQSMRKSILSVLVGMYADRGVINLESTLAQLGIDDKGGLTDQEKSATLKQLLQGRSGVYHPAALEAIQFAGPRPARGSAKPGEQFYYNNWDFNAVGQIFTKLTGKSVAQALQDDLATPLQMEDFHPATDVGSVKEDVSDIPAYVLRLSARDMARVGWLMDQNGAWDGKQLVSSHWVIDSTTAYSEMRKGSLGFGYMWFVATSKNSNISPKLNGHVRFAAIGSGGQQMLVAPELDLIIVQNADNEHEPQKEMSELDAGNLVGRVLDAMP